MTEENKQAEPQQEPHRSDKASKLMGDMLKGLKEFGNAAKLKAEELGKLASAKAEELTRLGKIKLDIHQLQKSKSKALSDLGLLAYTLNKEDRLNELAELDEFKTYTTQIDSLLAEIQAKEAQAEKVASEEGEAVVKS